MVEQQKGKTTELRHKGVDLSMMLAMSRIEVECPWTPTKTRSEKFSRCAPLALQRSDLRPVFSNHGTKSRRATYIILPSASAAKRKKSRMRHCDSRYPRIELGPLGKLSWVSREIPVVSLCGDISLQQMWVVVPNHGEHSQHIKIYTLTRRHDQQKARDGRMQHRDLRCPESNWIVT